MTTRSRRLAAPRRSTGRKWNGSHNSRLPLRLRPSADGRRKLNERRLRSKSTRRSASDWRRELAARIDYEFAVDVSSCSERWEDDIVRYQRVAAYASAPERDAAIDVLESCRKQFADAVRKYGTQTFRDLRKDFAIGIEDRFDEDNRFARGSLVAKVNGTSLSIRMKGNFEGRARHSEDQVNAWCEMTDYFSKVTLRNSHGTFSCTPPAWPGSDKKLLQSILKANLAHEPLPKAAGSIPVPPPREDGGENPTKP